MPKALKDGVTLESVANYKHLNLHSGKGDDLLLGWYARDELQGGEGNDVIYADKGNDLVDGGSGNDTLSGGLYKNCCTLSQLACSIAVYFPAKNDEVFFTDKVA